MSSLPREIEEEILLRLPVKSILRFKSVCKSWYRTITCPKFIKDHLSLATKNLRNTRIMIRVLDRHPGDYDEFYSIEYASTSSKCVPMDYPNYNGKTVMCSNRYTAGTYNRLVWSYHYIVGSCNGLILLDVSDIATLFLWNPSTREYKRITGPMELKSMPSYGFGYDTETDNYKLVCIATGDDDDYSEVHVYREGSWSRSEDIPYVYFDGTPGLLLNGALHWIGEAVHGSSRVRVILSFDINSDKFIDLPFPKETMRKAIYSVHVVGDSLCLACFVTNVRVDVWVMETYGVAESWTKQFTTANVNVTPYPNSFKLYRVAKNGEILMQIENRFGLYDQSNDEVRFLHVNCTDDSFWDSEIYVESLVSLNSGTFMGEKISTTRKFKKMKVTHNNSFNLVLSTLW